MKMDSLNTPVIDLVDSFNKESNTAHFFVKGSNMFCGSNHFLEPGLIEHFIQSTYKAIDSNFHIAEIKDFSIRFLPKIGESITTKIEVSAPQKNTVNVIATSKIDGVVAAKCRIKINLYN